MVLYEERVADGLLVLLQEVFAAGVRLVKWNMNVVWVLDANWRLDIKKNPVLTYDNGDIGYI